MSQGSTTTTPVEDPRVRVAAQWAAALAADRLDEALALYARRPVLRAGGDVIVGPTDVRRFWAASPLLGGPPATVTTEGPEVVLRWSTLTEGGGGGRSATAESRVRVSRGHIVEQTVDDVWRLGATAGAGDAALDVRTAGDVTDADRSYAADKVTAGLRAVAQPVLHATMRLEVAADPARERRARASVNVDLDGRPVRAQVEARSIPEAADLLERRLRDRVVHLGEHRQALRRRGPSSPEGGWRHGDEGTVRAPSFPRPSGEREVVRHKSCTTPDASVDEAIFDMEALDHDVHLFVEPTTGQDAVVWRRTGGRYGIRLLGGGSGPFGPTAAALDVDDRPAPRLTEDEARERLDAAHETWVFFEDADDGRGHVVYRRRDGHDGVVVPVDEAA